MTAAFKKYEDRVVRCARKNRKAIPYRVFVALCHKERVAPVECVRRFPKWRYRAFGR
jgi:hypothetical protein